MSQAGILNTSAGPVPPTVPTQFTADSGTAIPAANNLNVFGIDSPLNNDNGISTVGAGDTLQVVLNNRVTGAIATANATPTTVFAFNLGATPGVYIFEGNLVAFNSTDTAGAGYTFSSAFRTDGVTATEIATEFKDVMEEAAMATADFSIAGVGNTMTLTATGIAGKTINWNALINYRFVS